MFFTAERPSSSQAQRARPDTLPPEALAAGRARHPTPWPGGRGPDPSIGDVMQLQRSIGNRRTMDLIAEMRVQRESDRGGEGGTGSPAAQVATPATPVTPAVPAMPAAGAPTGTAPSAPAATPSHALSRGAAVAPASQAAASPGEARAAPGPRDAEGGDHAQPGAAGALDVSSTDAILASLAAVPPSALGPALASAQAATAGVQAGERATLRASYPAIEQPTGLPPRQRPALPRAAPAKGEAPEPKGGAEGPAHEYDTAAQPAQGPLPASGAPAAVAEAAADDGGSWWDWLIQRVRGFLGRIATTDAGLSTSAGDRPTVELSGAADPSRMGEHEQESAATVGKKQGEADQATRADFGENAIAPDVRRETLRSNHLPAAAKGGGAGRGRDAPASDAFDAAVSPSMHGQIQAENAKYGEARNRYQADSAALRAQSSRRIAEEDARTRKEQTALRQQTREQVDGARTRWRAENARAAQSFSDGAVAKRREAERQIDTKVADAGRQADVELTKAETEAENEKAEAERKAVEEKRKAEAQPRSWWERFKGAVSSALSAIRDTINGIFDAVRAKVRQLIQAAKALVRDLIDAARAAVVGLIRAFGGALKGLASIALAAFPEAAERARQWIDGQIESAVGAVNRAADALKAAAERALDWLAEGLDKLLAALQGVFDSILAAVALIVDLLLNLDRIWAQVVAKVREAAPSIPSDVAGVLRLFEDLRDFVQAPPAPASSPPAAAPGNAKGPEACPACDAAGTTPAAANESAAVAAAPAPGVDGRTARPGAIPTAPSLFPASLAARASIAGASDGPVGQRLAGMPSASTIIQRQLTPPGNCIQGIHDQMQRLVKQWCDHPSGRTCVPGESCHRLQQKIRRNQLCAQHRRAINDQCYEGGDLGHRIAEADARRAQANCMALYRAQCEQPPPVPVPREVPESAWERFKNFMRTYQRELALGVLIACVIALVALLVPEPVVSKIIAALSALTAVAAFVVLWVKFKNWDSSQREDNQA